MFEEVPYDEDMLFSTLSEEPGITILHHTYDEDLDNPWYRIGDMEGKFISLKWSNTNLDFLLFKNIEMFLNMDEFVAGYAFENNDVWDQTKKAKEKNESDPTLYPGQSLYVCGMEFMAAPLMWFGKVFFSIIPKNKLLEFEDAHINEKVTPDTVEIRLFDIYQSPAKLDNRDNQKRFWSFFNLRQIALKFEEDNAIDAAQSLKKFLAKRKSNNENNKK